MNTKPIKKTNGRAVIIWTTILVCMSPLISCDKPVKANPNSYLPFTLEEIKGNATMETKRFTLVFQGEKYEARSSGELQIGGSSGPTEVTAGELTGKYENGSADAHGSCTVKFRDHTFKLIDGGQRLSIQGTDVNLSPPKKTIMVKKDGNIVIKEE